MKIARLDVGGQVGDLLLGIDVAHSGLAFQPGHDPDALEPGPLAT